MATPGRRADPNGDAHCGLVGCASCRMAYSCLVSLVCATNGSIAMSIPRYPGDITREWLSTVLSSNDTPAPVSGVDVAAIGTGQTGATYRVSVSYATDAVGLPNTFVIKLPATDDSVRERV